MRVGAMARMQVPFTDESFSFCIVSNRNRFKFVVVPMLSFGSYATFYLDKPRSPGANPQSLLIDPHMRL